MQAAANSSRRKREDTRQVLRDPPLMVLKTDRRLNSSAYTRSPTPTKTLHALRERADTQTPWTRENRAARRRAPPHSPRVQSNAPRQRFSRGGRTGQA
eukprot:3397230-Prymnesium_polylepis.1